ncbi:uncharacterized protein AMSG_01116 [Thecamonas trahens ATCC 50062]|uniref:Dynein associated protein domain-containing protein n=1 Tax=Thecamonas trahens ATCC 50062 TaxID=461836 RepID=A0A0L0DIS5_THETB|nr:hypothetical protein AMSG_01116 [Thecamonas trahens ATCC 50062]KNC52289.1 hypothetical protein AMSG_01116 [Thecamonas trahens ATCC 50062]|eukprot:XP_013762288.1 hypothetical protein AMSG_01116 [Thecamonas trahens ATCC 50062]
MADEAKVAALEADVKKYKTMAKKLKAKAEAAEAKVAALERAAGAGGAVAVVAPVGDGAEAAAKLAELNKALEKEKNMVAKLKAKLKAEMKKSPSAGGDSGAGGGGSAGDAELIRKLKLKCKSLMQKLAAAQSSSGGDGSSSASSAVEKELAKRQANHKVIKDRLRKEMAAYKAAGESATDEDKKKLAKAKALYRKSEALIEDLSRKAAAASHSADGDETASVVSVASTTSEDSDKYKALAVKYKKMCQELQAKLKAAQKTAKAGGTAAVSASASATPAAAAADPGTSAGGLAEMPSDELAMIVVSQRKQLAHRHERIAQLEADVARLSSLDSDLEAINLDRDIAALQAANYKIELDTVRLELEDLRLDVELYRAREGEYSLALLEEASAENLAVQKLFYKSMEKQNKRLRDALVDVREVAASDRNEYKRQLDELAAVSAQYPAAQARIVELEDEVASLQDDIEHLRDQLDATTDAAGELEAMAEEKLLAEEQAAGLRAEVSDLNHMLELAENTIEAQLEEEIRLTEAALDADARADALLGDMEAMYEQLEASRDTIAQFRVLVADLQSQLDAASESSGGASEASLKLSALMASSAALTTADGVPDTTALAAAAKRAAAALKAAAADFAVKSARQCEALLAACMPASFAQSVAVDGGAATPANTVAMVGVVSRMQAAVRLLLDHFDATYDFAAFTRAGAPALLDDMLAVARVVGPLRKLATLLTFLAAGVAAGSPAEVVALAARAGDLAPAEKHLHELLDLVVDDGLVVGTSLEGVELVTDRVSALLAYCTRASPDALAGASASGSEASEIGPSLGAASMTASELVARAPAAVPLGISLSGAFRAMSAAAASTLLHLSALEASVKTGAVPDDEALARARAELGAGATQAAVVGAALNGPGAPTAAVLGALSGGADELRSCLRLCAKLVKNLGDAPLDLSNEAWTMLDTAFALLHALAPAAAAAAGAVKEALLANPAEDLASLADVVAAVVVEHVASSDLVVVQGYSLPDAGDGEAARALPQLGDALFTACGHVKSLVEAFLAGEYDDTSDATLGGQGPRSGSAWLALEESNDGNAPGGTWAVVAKAYRAAVAEAEAMRPALEAAEAEKERLQRAAKGREQALQEARVQSDVLGKRIEVLQERIDAVDELEAQVRKLKGSESTYREAIDALRKENDELKAAAAKANTMSPLAAFTRSVAGAGGSNEGGSAGPSAGSTPVPGSPKSPTPDVAKGKSILAALSGGGHKNPILSRGRSGSVGSGSGSAVSSTAHMRAIRYLRAQVQELKAQLATATLADLPKLEYGVGKGKAEATPGAAALKARQAKHALALGPAKARSGAAAAKRAAALQAFADEVQTARGELGSLLRETRTALAQPRVVSLADEQARARWLAEQEYAASLSVKAAELNKALAEGDVGAKIAEVTVSSGLGKQGAAGGAQLVLNEAQFTQLASLMLV